MKHLKKMASAALVAVLCSACAGTPVAMGSRGVSTVGGTSRPITAEACGFQLLLFIPISLNDRAERAYHSLQAQAGGDLITDVQVQEKWTYGFVGTSYCTVLKAKAVKPATS